MKSLLNFPIYGGCLEPWGGLEGLETRLKESGLDGLELVWGGEEMHCPVPGRLRPGYHLTFFPDWLDFWREDTRRLEEKFGSREVWTAFYGGPGPETLLDLYRADLDRAEALGAEYVVFHVSDVSIEEGYTYRWRHSDAEVIDAAAALANQIFADRKGPMALLLENQWWPGFTFTEPELTGRLLEAIRWENKGIVLDTGHLLNTEPGLESQAEGLSYIEAMLDRHGDLAGAVRALHLHKSLSGPYVRTNTGFLPEALPEDYFRRFERSYAHVLQIDRHEPWTVPEVAGLVGRVAPEWLIHELAGENPEKRIQALRCQLEALRKGGESLGDKGHFYN